MSCCRLAHGTADAPALPPLREVIARHGLSARRSLGQHFLLDGNLTARIARGRGPACGRHVIEVGPGPGGLTRALLASDAASVTVVEIDRRAIGALEELRAVYADRLRIVEADALAVDLAAAVPAPRQIIANLPYNIATPLLIGWLRQAAAYERLTLMFQLEVAARHLRRGRTRLPMAGCRCWRSGCARSSWCCAFRRPPSCRRRRCGRRW